MSVQLSSGALEAINDGAQIDKPVFQLLALKKLNPTAATNNSVDRYRILLSDGVHNNTAMLAVQLNQMVTDGQLEPNTVICLDRYVCNKLPGNRRVVIILELTVAAPAGQVGGKIGNPVALPLGGATGANGQQAPAPQRPLQQQQAMRAGASPMSVAKANSFPGAGSNFSRQPQGSFGGPGPSSGMMSPPKQAQPISSLTPYQNRWTIKARVSSKSAVRTWSNSRGEGKLFSMDLCDQSGEIRATAFKDQCDKFFDLIEVGKVYFFSRGTLKTANRQYTSITNDYEMTFNNDTTVVPCEEEDDSIPTMQFDFRSINQLEEMNKDAILDTTGEEAAVTSSTIVAKPTATVTPVPVLVPTTSSQAQGPQMQPPVQGRPVVFIRPTSDGAGPNQQMLPGYPVFTSQRFPAPGMTQQTFAFPGATPMIRVVQHHSSMPDARGPPQPATPTTTSTVTVTTSGTTATSTLAGPAQGFQIHFHHRPGYPPQPVIRLIQDTPPPRPGVHRCMHVHHGQPVFRTPTPATAPQTTTAPPTRTHISAPPPSNPSAPPTAAATAAAAARQPSHGTHSAKSAQSPPLSERKPEAEIHRPELAELAQRIHNLSADVKTIKPGSRGVPLDPREKQRREAAEASNARRKEIKAKVKTLRAENVSAASEIIQDSDSMNLPAPDDEALGISSTSSNEFTRRRKRRKRVKQQSPALGEAEQRIVTGSPAQTSDARKEKSTLGDSAKSGGQTESASDSKPDAEDEPAHDSDDSTSSESDHEEATNTEQKQKDPNLTRTSTETTHPVPVGPSLPEGFHDSDNEPETAGDTPLNSHPNNENQDNTFPRSTKDQKDSQVSQESPTEAIADHASANHSTRQPSADMTGMEKTGEPGANLENQLACSELEQQTRSKEVTETGSCYDGNNHSGTESWYGAAAIVLDQEATCDDKADVGVQPKLSESSKEIKQERSGHLSGSKAASPEVMSSQSTQSNASMESSNKVTTYTEAEMASGSSDASQNNVEVKPKSSRSTVFKTSTTRGVDGVPIPSSLPDTDVARTHRPQQHLQTLSTSLASSSEQHILRGESEELQRDHIDVEHKQLALERKCLNCERRNLLLKEERLQIEQDRLQAERDRLQALQEQVQLQRDQLELDRTRYELEREHLEVNRERLQVERNHLQQEEQRGEDSKMILQSLQEISQTLQMSVNLSLQGYGFPMSYEVNDRGATAVTEEYLQPQSFLQVESQEMWPAEETDIPGGGAVGGGTFYSEGEISGDEWTVVGRARGSSSHRESSRSAGQDQWVADSTVTSQSSVDTLAQGSRPPELAAPSPDVTHGSSTQQVQNLTKTGSSKEASGMQKGEKSSFGQKSSGDRSLSPVHGLSSMQERQRTRNNPNRRNHRQGRPSDNRRWHDRRNWKPNDSRNEPKK